MATVKIVLYKSKKIGDGKYPLAVRVIKDRKAKYFFTGRSLREEFWDENAQMVLPSYPTARRLNLLLKQKFLEAENTVLEMERQAGAFTIDQVEKRIRLQNKSMAFSDFSMEYIGRLQQEGKINQANSETSRLRNLLRFHKNRVLYFHEISVSFLNLFKTHMRAKDCSEKSINNHLIMIRTLFNRAIAEELISRDIYPFGGKNKVQICQVESQKIGLEKQELDAIEKLPLAEGSPQWHARNTFIISFNFAGMRIGDLLSLRWKDVDPGRLLYQMGKTRANVSISIPEKAREILSYYRKDRKSPSDFVFPYLKQADVSDPVDLQRKINSAQSQINKRLKQIAVLAGLEKNISSHIARHTFGNIAGDRIPIPMLQKLYRHKSMITTAVYQGNFIHKDTDEALLKVVGE
jgi:integrase/recombinase XerD